ncbi:hypothetical protein O1G21_35455 [Kitasatospora cathayae]|uniref:HTH marR-type domain-containing protein n=1 Tax=Kitasatospora cathayae TaxID=3004092 RepID=A0ABY7QIX3_9ACTN|nr:hypothetical protein [Kitasatospora sp. HUAS 3-15]WBP91866.1 hypothetical protein O1G21_35455 [Kitasatospora sp. HUAS 3-15]
MVNAGYVTRTRPPEDKRSVLVGLTDAGRARHRQRRQALAEALHGDLADCDEDALDRVAEVLHRLSAVYPRL